MSKSRDDEAPSPAEGESAAQPSEQLRITMFAEVVFGDHRGTIAERSEGADVYCSIECETHDSGGRSTTRQRRFRGGELSGDLKILVLDAMNGLATRFNA